MSIDYVNEAGKKSGVPTMDCATLCKHGLTEGTLKKCEGLGLTVKDLWEMMMQFGPQALTIITAFAGRCNKTNGGKKNGGGDEKKPKDEPAPPPETHLP